MIPTASDHLQRFLENDQGPSGIIYREIDAAMNRLIPTERNVSVRVRSPLLEQDFEPVRALLLLLGFDVVPEADGDYVRIHIIPKPRPRP